MPLRLKIFLILAGITLLYGAIDFAIQRFVVFPHFVALEQEEAKKDTIRCIEALQREIHHLDLVVHDWSAWTDTYEFVNDRNSEYIEDNLNFGSYQTANLNLIYIIRFDGTVVWSRTYLLDSQEEIELSEFGKNSFPLTHPLLAHDTETSQLADSKVSGMIATERGIMLVAARPILTSDNEGPAQGWLIMGRFLDDSVVDTIKAQTQVNFNLRPKDRTSLSADQSDILKHITIENPILFKEDSKVLLNVFTTFSDIQGEPILLLRADIPRKITAKGLTAFWVAIISILVSAVIVLLVMGILLKHTVIDPIGKLTNHAVQLGRTDDMSSRLKMNRQDEIGLLANEFDSMVEKLYETRKRLLNQYYQAGMSELAADALHEIRNALNPLTFQISHMETDLSKMPLPKMQSAFSEISRGEAPVERQENLGKFLALAFQRLSEWFASATAQLEVMRNQIAQIEKILAVQESCAHCAKPMEALKLEEIVNDAIRLLPESVLKGIDLTYRPSIRTLPPIRLQRMTLLHVFVNVLINAAESIRRGTVSQGKIDILAQMENGHAQKRVHVFIRDNGQGLNPEELKRIFTKNHSRKPEGVAGLGLHWCANAMAAMKGQIHVESAGIGKGATVHLVIPDEHTD